MGKGVLFTFFGLLSHDLMAQLIDDSSFSQPAQEKAIKEYRESKGQNLSIYNGVLHTGYSPSIEGSAYYKSNVWEKGGLFYEGIFYREVPLRYDMLKDEVIIQQPSSGLGIILFSPRVEYFSFLNSPFIYRRKETNSLIPEGFYEQLAKGKIHLMVKRKVIIDEKITTQVNLKFIRVDHFYVLKDGVYYSIKNAKAFLELLPDKRKTIQQYLNRNKIKFRKAPESTLLTIAEQYNKAFD